MQNKILSSFFKKLSTIFIWDHYDLNCLLNNFKYKSYESKRGKKGFKSRNQKRVGKSKLEVLTNENDFLVKNLKKAG